MKVIGIISDTHGLLRPEVKDALAGVDAIVHAGDVGSQKVLVELGEIAPLTAIRGNIDIWARDLPDTEALEVEGRHLYILHDVDELDLDPRSSGFDVVISGHSHKPDIHKKEGVLYLNPGSAGPRRFTLPVAVARLEVSANHLDPEIIEFAV